MRTKKPITAGLNKPPDSTSSATVKIWIHLKGDIETLCTVHLNGLLSSQDAALSEGTVFLFSNLRLFRKCWRHKTASGRKIQLKQIDVEVELVVFSNSGSSLNLFFVPQTNRNLEPVALETKKILVNVEQTKALQKRNKTNGVL